MGCVRAHISYYHHQHECISIKRTLAKRRLETDELDVVNLFAGWIKGFMRIKKAIRRRWSRKNDKFNRLLIKDFLFH